MKLKKILLIIFVYSTFIFAMSGLELAKKIDNKKKPKDSKSNTTMILTNKNGKQK
jgi:hypothetical protein